MVLTVLSQSFAQDAGRPGAARRQAIKPNVLSQKTLFREVTLSVDRATLQTGELATFSLTPANRSADPALVWTIKINGGTPFTIESGRSEFQYKFDEAGTYTVAASAETRVAGGDILDPSGITVNPVTVQIVPVALEIDPVNVVVGAPVTFTTRFQSSPQHRNLTYRFVVDDDPSSTWSNEPTVGHVFTTPGVHHVYVEIGTNRDPITRSGVKDINVVAPPPISVRLVADRAEVSAGGGVNFTASTLNAHEGLQFRFDYGDNQTSDWLTASASSHVYEAVGTYTAFVEARTDGQVVRSDGVVLTVAPGRNRPIWRYIGIAVVVSAAAWAFRKWKLGNRGPVPTAQIRPHVDMGTQNVDAGSSGAIRIRMHLRMSLGEGSYDVAASHDPVVKRQWRDNG